MKDILVKSLMSEQLICIPVAAPLQLAVKKMVENRCSCIIIKQNDLSIGIITERDLVKVLNQPVNKIDLSLPVSNFMTSPVLSLNENETLFDAVVISRAERIRHLPVMNNNDQLVGLVTQSDLANAHFRVIEMQSEIIENSVALKTSELQHLNDELQTLSMEDHLMKIGNRRAMEVDLGYTHNTSMRYGHPYSVLLMDLDFFKLYNDHYGHLAGDDALKSVASTLKAHIRKADRLYRYGGEELLIVLPYTNAAQAEELAEKLVAAVAQSAIPHEKSAFEVLTISCGGACALSKGKIINSWQQLVEQVDQNLYQAKSDGRNRTVVTQA